MNARTTLKIGPPTLRVKDLEKSLHFYEGALGLQINKRSKSAIDDLEIIELGFGGTFAGESLLDPILILRHDSRAKEPPLNFAGLFHFAMLVPNRKSLAQALSSLVKKEIEFEGFADHLVSESLYLHDPERNGIEIYRDRPFSEWNHDALGNVIMDTLPLDLDRLLAELPENRETAETFPLGAKIGHMHLRVTDLQQSARFYLEKLGLHISADWSRMGAIFLSAGSYHHHIGLNVWHSLRGAKHVQGEQGLEKFPITFPDYSPPLIPTRVEQEVFEVQDPDGIPIKIKKSV